MKKTFTSLLAFFVSLSVFPQSGYTISGKIIDAVSRLPLQGASVFAENTTLGTATNTEGVFHLQLPDGGYNLVITFTGYQTETKRITTADAGNSNMLIEIKQKEKSLEDVVVKATYEVADGLEKYGNFFLENFIGKTANSKQCTIKNKEVLKFYYYRRAKRLKILATAPLEIVNDALGYKIKYELDSFTHEYNTQVSQYTGYPLFEEMQPVNGEQKNKWNTTRLLAYNGSILHFMRSLYNRNLKEEGFEIQFLITFNEKETAVPVKNFYGGFNYSKDDSTQTVEVWPNQPGVVVIYKNEEPDANYLLANPDQPGKYQLSVLSFVPKESIIIEQNGYYFEQKNFTINQYLGWEKMADMLPYNFKEKEGGGAPKEVITKTVKPINEQTADIGDDLLTGVTWKIDESRVIDGNNLFYYKRGGQENSINYDNDFYKFNTNSSGTYFYNSREYKFTWKYLDTEKTKMEIIILYPGQLIVNLENIVLTTSSFKYTRLQKVNGINLMAIETRTIK